MYKHFLFPCIQLNYSKSYFSQKDYHIAILGYYTDAFFPLVCICKDVCEVASGQKGHK